MKRIIEKVKLVKELFFTDLEVDPIREKKNMETNLIYCFGVGLMLLFLSIVNFRGGSYAMAISTISGAVICFAGTLVGKIRKHTSFSSACVSVALCILFTYWIVFGGNNGFATIWIAIAPPLAMLAHGLRHGTYMSIYLGTVLVVFFYTPMQSYLQYEYAEIFQQRFPIVYFVSLISSFYGLLHQHKIALENQEQRKKYAELQLKADEANRTKSRFLANMSHEIRTPINGILGMDEIILNESKDPQLTEYALNIKSAGNTLLAIVNNILDITKVEMGKVEIANDRYDLREVIRDCYNITASRAKNKGIDLNVKVNPNLPSELIGDELHIRQIINNLLSNAVKYTHNGEINFQVDQLESVGGIVLLQIVVQDTGIGIKEEDIPKLFDSFSRLDEERNRNIEGTGLGLNLTYNMVRLMNGKISVESTYGIGSTFTVVIPQISCECDPIGKNTYKSQVNAINEQEKVQLDSISDARILIVDDVELNLMVLVGLLKDSGIAIDMARDGLECIQCMDQREYNIVFLDDMMPNMSGAEAMKAWKNMDHKFNVDTPIIMLTANAVVGAREKYLDLGFSDYLTKPISINSLNEIVNKYVSVREKNVVDESQNENSINEEESKRKASEELVSKMKRVHGIDTGVGMSYTQNNASFYIDMVKEFITNEKTSFIVSCYDSKDYKNYETYVHGVKSSSLTLGFVTLSNMALELENAVERNDSEYIDKNHLMFIDEYKRIIIEISAVFGL